MGGECKVVSQSKLACCYLRMGNGTWAGENMVAHYNCRARQPLHMTLILCHALVPIPFQIHTHAGPCICAHVYTHSECYQLPFRLPDYITETFCHHVLTYSFIKSFRFLDRKERHIARP